MSSIQVFNVKSYGALGNGTNSDSAAIQNAINAAQQAGGGIVYMPAGTYLLTSSLTIGKNGATYYSGITLQGAGQSSTTLTVAQNATFTPVVVTGDPANLASWGYHVLRDFAVTSAAPATTGGQAGITVEYCLLPQIRDVNVTDFARGLYAIGTIGLRCYRLYITSASTATTVVGAYLDGTTQNASIYFFHCKATFSQTTPTTVGFYCIGAHIADQYIHFCEAHGATYGILYDGSAAVNAFDQLDVHFYQFVAASCVYGILVQNTTAAGGMVNIDGAWYSPRGASGTGVWVNSASGVQIRAAQIYSNQTTTNGVFIGASSTDCSITQCVFKGEFASMIEVSASSYVSIFGNNLLESVTNSGSTGIYINGGSNQSIVGNTMRGISGTSVMNFGLFMDTSASNIVISNNVIDTATVTTPYTSGAGTGIVKVNNIGF